MIPHLYFTDFQLLSQLLLLCSLLLPALSLPDSGFTFNGVDPESGVKVTCTGCPPGKYLRQSCTSSKPSICEQCPPGSFTQIWNSISRCLQCGLCGRNMVVKTECSPHSDCQCECKPGYFFNDRVGMCVGLSECPTGSGVSVRGSPYQNTVCTQCPNGTFSDQVSTELNCTSHSLCESFGAKTLLKGSSWHNTLCATCPEARSKNAEDYLKDILPSFFSHHKLGLRRLRQVVSKLPSADGRAKRRRSVSGLNQPELESHLKSWITTSSADFIRTLPLILKETGAFYTAERMENKLRRIESTLQQFCQD